VFCRITTRAEPSAVVFEDAHTLAFLDIAPATTGHTPVVPKRHADDLLTSTAEDLVAVTRTTQVVAQLLDHRLTPDGLTVFQANRPAGWQDVFHLHFHVVPRWAGDSLVLPWKAHEGSVDDLAPVAARLGTSPSSGRGYGAAQQS
jgi:histidine triad (HIT) family protein